MKKTIFTLIFLMFLVFAIFGQGTGPADRGPTDLVVLLDTSASMSRYHWETSEYLIGPFLRDHLRIGDTFHLITFGRIPRFEISRRVEGIGDVEAIIGRLLLVYPLDPQGNLTDALQFAENYTRALPGGRPRRLILISDGNAPGTANLVSDAAARLRGHGIDFLYIEISAPQLAQAGISIRPPVAVLPPADARPPVAVVPPADAIPPADARPPVDVVAPADVRPPADAQPPADAMPADVAPPADVIPPVAVVPPADAIPPADVRPPTAPEPGVQPLAAGTIAGLPLPLLIALGLLILGILALIIFFALRNLHSSPNRVMAQAASPANRAAHGHGQASQTVYPPPKMKPLPKDKTDYNADSAEAGPLMLNLFVADQNTAIGRRNIHLLKPGYSLSVGGGKSDFLIFLVPLPPNIATIRSDGRNCTFIPRDPKFFPDLGTQQVPNCIGKTIRVISEKNYELHIRMDRYQDPLIVLNKLLNSISVPGVVK